MEYRNLGNSGVKVSVIAVGAMNFGLNKSKGGAWIGPGLDEQASVEIVRSAYEQGVNFIDTADLYQGGVSEEYVGKGVQGFRDEVVIATKVNAPTGPGVNSRGLSAYHIKRACEGSLKRLGTDRIDLYQLHCCSFEVPHEETLRALDDLIREGKVIYIGCSNYPAWMITEALGIQRLMNSDRFISAQPRYNLLDRSVETDILPVCERGGLGLLPWSPLSAGLLSGKYQRGQKPTSGRWSVHPYNRQFDRLEDWKWKTVEAVVEIAKAHGAEPAQVACAWLLSRKALSSVLGGANSVEQMKSYIGTADVKLTAEDVAKLDEVSEAPQNIAWRPTLTV